MGNGRSVRLVPSRRPFLSGPAEPSPGERNGRCSRAGIARGSSDARARLPRTARRGSPQSRPSRASGPRCRRRRSSPRRRGAAAHRDRRSPSDNSARCRCLDGSASLGRGPGRRTEQLTVRGLLRIEDDLDRLRMRAVVTVGRVQNIAAGVADPGRTTPGRFRKRSSIPQKHPPARIAFSTPSLTYRPPCSPDSSPSCQQARGPRPYRRVKGTTLCPRGLAISG